MSEFNKFTAALAFLSRAEAKIKAAREAAGLVKGQQLGSGECMAILDATKAEFAYTPEQWRAVLHLVTDRLLEISGPMHSRN